MYWEVERKEKKKENQDYHHPFNPSHSEGCGEILHACKQKHYKVSCFSSCGCSFDTCILSAFTTKHSNLCLHEHILPYKMEKKVYLPQQLQKQSWENSSQQAGQGYVSFPLLFLLHLEYLQLIYNYDKVVYNYV